MQLKTSIIKHIWHLNSSSYCFCMKPQLYRKKLGTCTVPFLSHKNTTQARRNVWELCRDLSFLTFIWYLDQNFNLEDRLGLLYSFAPTWFENVPSGLVLRHIRIVIILPSILFSAEGRNVMYVISYKAIQLREY